ncbi:telomere-protecting terminal protein Tpg [Streptomyces acidicola]|uniref:telomere-protecting terminal protein Tpg n=1 Tax=Streptomyces acidicola TaxID=2596892 RepID=UPI0038031115
MTCTDPSRTPPPPPSSAAAGHRTPGSTAEPSHPPPHLRSSSRTHVTARDQKHLLSGKRKNPPKNIAQKLANEVRASAKPRLQKKVIKEAKNRPVTVRTRAKIGYTNSASNTTTPDPRMRMLAKTMPATYASPLWQALEDGDEAEALRIIREYIEVEYIQDAGGNNAYTEIEITDIQSMEFDF